MVKKILVLSLLIFIAASVIAVPVRVVILRGGYIGSNWNYAAQYTYQRLQAIADSVSGIDIILVPEFGYAGTDGGTHSRPEVTFTGDGISGYIPHPRDAGASEDVRTAAYLDSTRYIAIRETCYVWASTCGEVITSSGINYNTIPIFLPDGRLYRLRRKNYWGGADIVRDTTIHCDTIMTKSGARVAVFTTICYENGSGGFTLFMDPTGPPAPVWLLPHGSWPPAGNPDLTYRTQRWIWNSSAISLSGVWNVPTDGWVRADAVLISCDIFTSDWTATGIDNYGYSIDPLAYEPLAWVAQHTRYVVVDINVPSIDDPTPAALAKPMPPSEPHPLIALPLISTGPVFVSYAKGSEIKIYNVEGEIVKKLAPVEGEASWEGIYLNANPPGVYTVVSGGESAKVTLIP